MSWLVVLRPVREEMPFEPTEEESQVVSAHYEYLSTRTTAPMSRRSSPPTQRS